jgi:hypothetical protein
VQEPPLAGLDVICERSFCPMHSSVLSKMKLDSGGKLGSGGINVWVSCFSGHGHVKRMVVCGHF